MTGLKEEKMINIPKFDTFLCDKFNDYTLLKKH